MPAPKKTPRNSAISKAIATCLRRYPSTSTFGARIKDLKPVKDKVAKYLVDHFLSEGSSVFIGDGSSTFFVALHMFERDMQATIWTNHLAVAHEYVLEASSGSRLNGMEMSLAGGRIDRDLMMTYGHRATKNVSRWTKEAQCVVLSVRSVFPDRGPAGLEQRSLVIKRRAVEAAMESGATIVLVADHNKFPGRYNNQPLVFQGRTKWRERLLMSENFFIVTNDSSESIFVQTKMEFHEIMKERFIVI